jgi:hypothetical protein
LAGPELFENRVRKPEHQNILHRFLAEVMVDAEDLLLMGKLGEFRIKLLGGSGRAKGFSTTIRCQRCQRHPSIANPHERAVRPPQQIDWEKSKVKSLFSRKGSFGNAAIRSRSS